MALIVLENVFLIWIIHYVNGSPISSNGISGVYRLTTLQGQNSNQFEPMEDVDILKIFVDGYWISPAYRKDSKEVVSLSGGYYLYNPDDKTLTEEVAFNMKDPSSIGLKTTYKFYLESSGFYQSGIYKEGTPDAWKVEENWVREPAN